MKGKLYIFGIGGTGSRVLKSLVMLAASGVDIEADAIVPIVIDPDFANAEVHYVNTVKNATEYVVTPTVGTYTYVRITNNISYINSVLDKY